MTRAPDRVAVRRVPLQPNRDGMASLSRVMEKRQGLILRYDQCVNPAVIVEVARSQASAYTWSAERRACPRRDISQAAVLARRS